MAQSNPFRRSRIDGDRTRWHVFVTGLIFATVILGWAHYASLTPFLVIPTAAMPSPNAFDYFNRASSLTKDGLKVEYALAAIQTHPSRAARSAWPGSPPGTRPTPLNPDDHVYSHSEKERLLAKNALALQLIRQGLAVPYRNPPIRSFAARTTYYGRDSFLARLLTLEAQVRAGRGDWGGAINSDIDAIQLGVALSHGSPLLGWRRGIDCQDTGRMAAWPDVPHLSAVQAKMAAHQMEAIQARQSDFGDVLQEDEWTKQASLLELMQAPDWKSQFVDMAWSDNNPRLLRLRLALTTKRGLIGCYTHIYDLVRQRVRSSYRRDTPPPSSLLGPITGDYESALQDLWFLDTANRTQNSLFTATLALQAYRQEHGAYPFSLTALAPAYLSHIPTDPFNAGRPLQYRHTKSTYLLFSIGPDRRDDGGAPVINAAFPAKSTDQPNPRFVVDSSSRGDIVAGVNTNPPLRGSM